MAKAAKKASGKKALSKSQVIANLSEATGVAKKDVGNILNALANEIQKSLAKNGPGVFTIPGLIKITKRQVPARPAQFGVLNRLTGKIEDRPAKPASVKVAVRALKNLKAMVS
jgi:nucleoid DNA-binding protein